MWKNIINVLAVASIFTLCGCAKKPAVVKSGTIEVMGTFASIVATAENKEIARAAVSAAVEKLHYVDKLMSDYDPKSELSKVNREGFGKAIKVDADLLQVLNKSVEYSRVSEGAFDVTIGPVVDLWHIAGEQSIEPTAEQIATAKSKVGYEKLIIDNENSTVRFSVDGMRIDLGGIAKGYAIDLAIEATKQNGALGAMVDVGGDIRCYGSPSGKEYWRIGLQDHRKQGQILLVLKLNDAAVATSGDYQRFVVIDKQQHSHIMNPAMADSARELSSVTVIAPTAIQADALATAVTVVGSEKGIRLIEAIAEAETLLIPNSDELELMNTAGIGKYIDTNFNPDSYSSPSKTTE
jgi:thiamine biosynthesis lipoprotein